jgi:APA family basic amino acid/polyamine antiporter
VIGFSSFSVLFYYSVGHASAMQQPKGQRLMPRWLNILGIALCVIVAGSFGLETFAISSGILATALVIRWLWRQVRSL